MYILAFELQMIEKMFNVFYFASQRVCYCTSSYAKILSNVYKRYLSIWIKTQIIKFDFWCSVKSIVYSIELNNMCNRQERIQNGFEFTIQEILGISGRVWNSKLMHAVASCWKDKANTLNIFFNYIGHAFIWYFLRT